MISVTAIDHVVFRVQDVEKVAAFYIDVLGAHWEKVQADIGLYQLRTGDALIDLVPINSDLGRMGGAGPGKEGHNVDHVCLRVAPWDGEAILAQLSNHGLTDLEIATRYGAGGYGPSIYLSDPEGNRIELKGPAQSAS